MHTCGYHVRMFFSMERSLNCLEQISISEDPGDLDLGPVEGIHYLM